MIALPSVATHSGPSERFGFGRPPLTMSGRFWRAYTMFGETPDPPCQEITSVRPSRYRTNVARSGVMGAYVWPLKANPPPESFSLKPLLKVATRPERIRTGTSAGPREAI